MSISSNRSDPEPGDPNRSRVYHPPVGRNHAARRPASNGWAGARSVLVILAAVLGLASLSVAAAHFWPGTALSPLPGDAGAPSAAGSTASTEPAASSSSAATDAAALTASEPAPTPTED